MNDISSVLLSQGLPGVVILSMGFVIMRLYGDNKQLQKDKDALQEYRRLDAKETTDKVIAPLQGISQTLTLVYDKLVLSKKEQ